MSLFNKYFLQSNISHCCKIRCSAFQPTPLITDLCVFEIQVAWALAIRFNIPTLVIQNLQLRQYVFTQIFTHS